MHSIMFLCIVLLILPSVLFHICSCETEIPEFFMYETVYPTPVTLADVPRTSVQPGLKGIIPNTELFKIPDHLRHLDSIMISGTLRQAYLMPESTYIAVNQTYVYRLPALLHIGDNITISGSLQDNAKRIQFKLLYRELHKNYDVDYKNVPMRFNADITNVTDIFKIDTLYKDAVITRFETDQLGRTFDNDQFIFQIGVNPKSVSNLHFTLDIFCNYLKVHSLVSRDLDRVGYLQISGHYSMVHDIKINFL